MKKPGFRITLQKPNRLDRPWHPALYLAKWLVLGGIMATSVSCSERDHQDRVVVFAASSLAQALGLIETEFETLHPAIDLELIFAGSNTLAMQINAGAPADLFLSADDEQMQRVEGFALPSVLVENQLVAIVPSGSPASTIADAIERASRIIVAQGDVPAGRYTRRALDELGVWETAEPKIVSYEHAAQGVLSKVAFGQGDLGFVYRTDALGAEDKVRMIEFPPGISVKTQTWIAQRANTLDAQSPRSLVADFITSSSQSQAIFANLGFVTREASP